MEKRIIFPTVMFLAAGVSFAFGTWQYIYAQRVQASSAQRMAYVMTTIEDSDVSPTKKQELYASIAAGLPSAPSVFGIDVSGSFASQTEDDQCANEGIRSICRSLKAYSTNTSAISSICGICDPKP
jgi:hypothetical protein